MRTKRILIQKYLLLAFMLLALTASAQTVTKMSCGGGTSLFLKEDGSLWGMGLNYYGELGIGTFTTSFPSGSNQPVLIVTNGVTAIAGGDPSSMFLKSDGSLWVMGENNFGQLGDGTTSNRDIPELIEANGVLEIASGGAANLFLKTDGSLWGMGNNRYGELGDGTYNNTNRPEQLVPGGVKAIAAGESGHSLFLASDSSLWVMGFNEFGELGIGTFTTNSPFGTNHPVFVTNGVQAIAAGTVHSLFLKTDGSLWGMGYNYYGQLGDGTTNNSNVPVLIVSNGVVAVSGGGYDSLFIKSDGSLWGMGQNQYGQLGDGTTNNSYIPELIVSNSVTGIAVGGDSFSLFLKSDGSLWGMGENNFGQLGDRTFNNTNRPVLILSNGVPLGFNQLSLVLLNGGQARLSYLGLAGTNYALDRTFNLSAANWVPQITNTAGGNGVQLFTNAPNTSTNNFWRIRSVP